jgi:hypothetical protein
VIVKRAILCETSGHPRTARSRCPLVDDTDRVIVTKHETYVLREGEEGQPIEEAWPNTAIPDRIKGAKIYETEDGPVVALPSSI